jgi:hypothetical protein
MSVFRWSASGAPPHRPRPPSIFPGSYVTHAELARFGLKTKRPGVNPAVC